jgi:single-strand DNA-binding protein
MLVAQNSGRKDGAGMPKAGNEGQEWANEVRLVGRVSAEAEGRELPSGDQLAQFRLVVPRQDGRPGGSRVDTIDVSCWSGRARLAASRLGPGDTAEVTGSLRRRFFRAGGSAASRYDVEAKTVRRLRKAE